MPYHIPLFHTAVWSTRSTYMVCTISHNRVVHTVYTLSHSHRSYDEKKNRPFKYSTKLLEKTESKRDIYMLSSTVEGITRIEIQKRLNLIQVIIYMGFPKLLIKDKPRKLKELEMNVQKELNCMNRKLNIAITRIGNLYGHPNILAEFIAEQLKNQVSSRKAIKILMGTLIFLPNL
ncbi:hypothetical protein J1N35_040302 [Gossypium stocksii]|uniref:Uncharacterized protein n=1 Tax=Gossypium stocksii TaxID=47602 RepID=A0A9D3UDY2_9ROSI|nr:hypothetical protein J1N35_040302 [Gossypium stocksii]